MEVGSCSCSEKRLWALSVMEAFMIEAAVHVYESLTCLVLLTRQLLNGIDGLPKIKLIDESFSLDELHKRECPEPDIKDASETEEDDDEDEDNADEQDDDEDDEDFSGEEGEEGDPEDDPEANGDGGSEDDDEDDDGDEDDVDEDEDEDEEDEEDEEDAQPPSKKRK